MKKIILVALTVATFLSISVYAQTNKEDKYRHSLYGTYQLDLYTKECKDNNLSSCDKLAQVYLDNEEISVNREKASKLFEKACIGGFTKSCASAGNILSTLGKYKQAKKSLKLGCHANEWMSCFLLSSMYKKDSQEYEKYLSLMQSAKNKNTFDKYSKNCINGTMRSCTSAGNTLITMKRTNESKKYFDIGCNKNKEWMSCFFLSRMDAVNQKKYINLADKYSQKHPLELFKTQCKKNFSQACSSAGALLITRDKPQEALQYLNIGCKAKDLSSCYILEK